jgi:hypothetical protein
MPKDANCVIVNERGEFLVAGSSNYSRWSPEYPDAILYNPAEARAMLRLIGGDRRLRVQAGHGYRIISGYGTDGECAVSL